MVYRLIILLVYKALLNARKEEEKMIKETYILEVNDFYTLKENSWSGAIQTLDAIEEKRKEEEFIDLLNEILTCNEMDGIKWTDTQLNDFIWFDTDYIEETLNIKLWEE